MRKRGCCARIARISCEFCPLIRIAADTCGFIGDVACGAFAKSAEARYLSREIKMEPDYDRFPRCPDRA